MTDFLTVLEQLEGSQLPALGSEEGYLIGNGIVAAGATPAGTMDFLIGPDYTSPTYLKEGLLFASVDGGPFQLLNPERYRCRGCAIYRGETRISGVHFTLFDFAVEGEALIARVCCCRSHDNQPHAVILRTRLTPQMGEKTRCGLMEQGLLVEKDRGVWCFGNHETHNWEPRSAFFSFDLPYGGIMPAENTFELTRAPLQVAAGDTAAAGLYTALSYTPQNGDPSALLRRKIISRDPQADLCNTFKAWKTFESRSNGWQKRVHNEKAAAVIDSLLTDSRVQLNRDGGMVSMGGYKYANSYIRDRHGAARGFLAAGYLSEVESILRDIHRKCVFCGHIPNWCSCGSDSFIGPSFHDERVEITGYTLLMMRDYCRAAGNDQLAGELFPTLEYAADAQIACFEELGYLDFNGDETEKYCCEHDGQEYGVNPDFSRPELPSFPSMCIAVASLDYFSELLIRLQKNPVRYKEAADRIRAAIDRLFWDEKEGFHWWCAFPEGGRPIHQATNYQSLPLWIGAVLTNHREKDDALALKKKRLPSGFLPNLTGKSNGFCGHSLSLFLYDLVRLHDPEREEVLHTILNSDFLSRYGTVWEFYGPGCVNNGHGHRFFEGGPLAEALIACFCPDAKDNQIE